MKIAKGRSSGARKRAVASQAARAVVESDLGTTATATPADTTMGYETGPATTAALAAIAAGKDVTMTGIEDGKVFHSESTASADAAEPSMENNPREPSLEPASPDIAHSEQSDQAVASSNARNQSQESGSKLLPDERMEDLETLRHIWLFERTDEDRADANIREEYFSEIADMCECFDDELTFARICEWMQHPWCISEDSAAIERKGATVVYGTDDSSSSDSSDDSDFDKAGSRNDRGGIDDGKLQFRQTAYDLVGAFHKALLEGGNNDGQDIINWFTNNHDNLNDLSDDLHNDMLVAAVLATSFPKGENDDNFKSVVGKVMGGDLQGRPYPEMEMRSWYKIELVLKFMKDHGWEGERHDTHNWTRDQTTRPGSKGKLSVRQPKDSAEHDVAEHFKVLSLCEAYVKNPNSSETCRLVENWFHETAFPYKDATFHQLQASVKLKLLTMGVSMIPTSTDEQYKAKVTELFGTYFHIKDIVTHSLERWWEDDTVCPLMEKQGLSLNDQVLTVDEDLFQNASNDEGTPHGGADDSDEDEEGSEDSDEEESENSGEEDAQGSEDADDEDEDEGEGGFQGDGDDASFDGGEAEEDLDLSGAESNDGSDDQTEDENEGKNESGSQSRPAPRTSDTSKSVARDILIM